MHLDAEELLCAQGTKASGCFASGSPVCYFPKAGADLYCFSRYLEHGKRGKHLSGIKTQTKQAGDPQKEP